MIRLSNLADYAVIVMTAAAQHEPCWLSAPALATETGLPVPTVAKVLGILARAELLQSQRGASGGYSLAKSPSRISVADVVEAVDGPIALAQCLDTRGDCAIEGSCNVRPHWAVIGRTVREALAGVTIADLIARPAAEKASEPATQKGFADAWQL